MPAPDGKLGAEHKCRDEVSRYWEEGNGRVRKRLVRASSQVPQVPLAVLSLCLRDSCCYGLLHPHLGLGGQKSAWINKELLTKLKHKKEAYEMWKQDQVTHEEYRDSASVCEVGVKKSQMASGTQSGENWDFLAWRRGSLRGSFQGV